jgi:glucose 1-dehydrogenase
MPADLSLIGRMAIVTGAGSGIGRALAMGLAQAGASVVIAERDASAGDAAAHAINSMDGRAFFVQCNVADRNAVTEMVTQAIARFGRPDILVNNAGVTSTFHLLELPEEEWDRVLNVNLKGVFLCSQAVGLIMAQHGKGVIINISSQLGDAALRNKAHYVSSKGGVKMLTKAMALDLAPYGIRVNAVAPGPIETELAAPVLSDPVQRSALLQRLPFGRFGHPDDLVGAVLFLASDFSTFITGTTLYVDGGYLAG